MERVECYCLFSPKKLNRPTNSIKSKPKSNSGSGSGPGSSSNSPRTPKSSVAINFSPPRTSSSRRGRSLMPSREEEMREVFRRFDVDCDGKISAGELRSYFASIGEYMSYEDARAIIEQLDSDKDNMLDFKDFLRLMDDGQGGEEDLKAAFEIFEYERGSGRITPKSLQRVLDQLGESKSYDECETMIRTFDREGKGEIGYNEFQQMMMA